MVEHGAESFVTKPERQSLDSLHIKIETPNKFDDSDLIQTAIPSASKLLSVADFGSFDPTRRGSLSTQHYGAIIANSTRLGSLENKVENTFSKLEEEINETGKKLREASFAVDVMQQALNENPTLRPQDVLPAIVQELSAETSPVSSPMSPISEEFHTPTSAALKQTVEEFAFPLPDANIQTIQEKDDAAGKSSISSEAAGLTTTTTEDISENSKKTTDDSTSETSSMRSASRFSVNLGLRKTSVMVQQDALKDFVDDNGTVKSKITFKRKLQETKYQIKEGLKKAFRKDKHK